MKPLALALLALPLTTFAQKIDLGSSRIVDLTHPFNEKTPYWPTAPSGFELKQLAYGKTEGGFFYSSYAISAPEHGGTHLDAPIHFAEGHHTTDEIPVDRLIGPAVVIDVSSKCAANRDYRATRQDVLAFEKKHGRIAARSLVLLRTGWSRFYHNRKEYFGDDKPGDASNLHFPSYGEDAARLLVEERKVAALGVDTPSIDYGQSRDFIVHQISAKANVYGLENLAKLDELPPKGAVMFALPMKIERGSGGPVRAVAVIPKAR